MRPVRTAVIGALLAAGTLPAAGAGASLRGAAAIAVLNAQRAANGIPADLAERADWTKACSARTRALERSGGPGYAAQGQWSVTNVALARDSWTRAHDPWAQMPVQAMALLSPLLTQLGASSSARYVCATTRPGYLRPAPATPSLYPYPGDGAQGVPYEQWSYGFPFTPGDFADLPAGFTTGPNLFVMADIGGEARVTGASLSGPDGPVEVRTVDNSTDQIGAVLAPGAVIIPVDPLTPGRTYAAAASVAIGGIRLTRRWSFTTALADPHTLLFVSSAAVLDAAAPGGIRQGNVEVQSSSPAPVHVSVVRAGQTLGAQDLNSGEHWTPPQTPGSFVACAHQDATDRYAAFDACRPLKIRTIASFNHPTRIAVRAAIVGRMLRYKLTVHPALGRMVKLSARRLVNGGWHTFRTVTRRADRAVTRTITARDTDQAVQVAISVPSGRSGAEAYRAATVVKTIHRRASG
jgi:hypothetical protein